MQKFDEDSRHWGSADTRLEQHRVASSKRLDNLDSRKKQGIISRADDEDHAKRFAVDLSANTGKPERQASPSKTAGREEPVRFALEKPAGLGERKNFSCESFRGRPTTRTRGCLGETGGMFRDEAAKFPDTSETPDQRRIGPALLGGSGCSHR
jgi:hypothetical protein